MVYIHVCMYIPNNDNQSPSIAMCDVRGVSKFATSPLTHLFQSHKRNKDGSGKYHSVHQGC